ncbi:hypothetical protein BT63DRAFT_150101 [Microthyrium microscopicum]|uniref:Arrestin-like N-terminal domain-containing protein n=1 Tax=Microthyrium microscopicum TaxID=703497 RepID=A0A6A6ULU5_9PEZI|nr:hypothetical protein BT63DRAFT_150101 [Microthyrium microscopicum]
MRQSGDSDSSSTEGDALLIFQSKQLYQNHYTVKPDKYTWKFEFTFPSKTDPAVGGGTGYSLRPEGTCVGRNQVHPLPPSYSISNGSDRAEIYYYLEAVMTRQNPKLLRSKKEQWKLPLTYVATRDVQVPDPGPCCRESVFQIRSMKLLPGKQELSFREKMHSVFKRDELPWAHFRVRLFYPTTAYYGCVLPVQLAVVAVDVSEDLVESPQLVLTSVVVKVKSRCDFRCGPSSEWSLLESEYCLCNATKIDHQPLPQVIDQSISKDDLLLVAKPGTVINTSRLDSFLDLSTFGTGKFRMPNIDPGFSSVNVALSHRIKVKVKLRCADKEFSFEHADTLTVLSRHVRKTSELSSHNTRPRDPPRRAMTRESVEPPLPAYSPGASEEKESEPAPPRYTDGFEAEPLELPDKQDLPLKRNDFGN